MAALDIPAPMEQTPYDRKVARLVELSADGHDAYDDIDWGQEVDPEDPRLALFSFDPLSRTDWYAHMPPARKAEIGLVRAGSNLRTGWQFENLLQQGLLRHAYAMNNTNGSFRYLHAEVMEESQHTLMFWEFIRRHAPHVEGITGWRNVAADPLVYVTARATPALFYFMVLGGELPVDHLQRLALKEEAIHPLLRRIMEIHVEEEARHVAFANEELRRIVPSMSAPERSALSLAVPAILSVMVPMMTNPSPWMVNHYDIPRSDLRRAFGTREARALQAASAHRIQRLAASLGLMNPAATLAWKRARIWSSGRVTA